MTNLELILLLFCLLAFACVVLLFLNSKKKDSKIIALNHDLSIANSEKLSLQAQIDTICETHKALDAEREQRQQAIDAERERKQKEIDAAKEQKQREIDAEREAKQQALDAEREERQKALEEQRIQAQKAIDEQRELAFARQKEQMDKSLQEMSNAFKVLSAQNSEHFKQQSQQAVGELLKPLQEKFEAFGKSIKESDVNNAERNSNLQATIKFLAEQSLSVGNQAKALADAITGQSKVQGDFGEMLLVDLLRNSGLKEGENFDVQSVILDDQGHEIKSDEGSTMIPDVIVHYPDGGDVIVDSKVSLKAFVAWNQATTVEDKERLANEHVRSIEKHINELRGKDYASYIPEGRKKIDYNIMFVPIEGAFQLMQNKSPLLWQKAKDAKVLIVSQMSLTVVLNMVLVAWRQHYQQTNIEEVYDTASELMSVIKNWLDSYDKLGEIIAKASAEYAQSTRLLKDSNQSVIKKINKLQKLGVSPKRSKAAIKAGGRKGLAGQESVIPQSLTPIDDSDE